MRILNFPIVAFTRRLNLRKNYRTFNLRQMRSYKFILTIVNFYKFQHHYWLRISGKNACESSPIQTIANPPCSNQPMLPTPLTANNLMFRRVGECVRVEFDIYFEIQSFRPPGQLFLSFPCRRIYPGSPWDGNDSWLR